MKGGIVRTGGRRRDMTLGIKQLGYFGQVGKTFRGLAQGIRVERKCKMKRLHDSFQNDPKYKCRAYIKVIAVEFLQYFATAFTLLDPLRW